MSETPSGYLCIDTTFSAEMSRVKNMIARTRKSSASLSFPDGRNPRAVKQVVGRRDGWWASLVWCPPSVTLNGLQTESAPATS